MGGPKLFAKLGDEVFVRTILRRLVDAAIAPVVVVVAAPYLEQARELFPTARWEVNPEPTRGMLSSLHVGIRALGALDGYLVVPVDHPTVRSDSYRALVQAFAATPHAVIRPVFDGEGGHPLLIPHALAAQLGVEDVVDGLAARVRTSGLPVRSVWLDDPGVVTNLNAPEDVAPPLR